MREILNFEKSLAKFQKSTQTKVQVNRPYFTSPSRSILSHRYIFIRNHRQLLYTTSFSSSTGKPTQSYNRRAASTIWTDTTDLPNHSNPFQLVNTATK